MDKLLIDDIVDSRLLAIICYFWWSTICYDWLLLWWFLLLIIGCLLLISGYCLLTVMDTDQLLVFVSMIRLFAISYCGLWIVDYRSFGFESIFYMSRPGPTQDISACPCRLSAREAVLVAAPPLLPLRRSPWRPASRTELHRAQWRS